MGKVNRKKRHLLIKRKKQRREKIDRLRARYLGADAREREKILGKIGRISPTSPAGEVEKSRR